MRRVLPCGGLIGLAVGLTLMGETARADVLISALPPTLSCGEDIEVGVWYQSYSGGPRRARIDIKSVNGHTLARKSVRATTQWRYWSYTPRCGRRYSVTYTTPAGPTTFRVRVRD